MNLEEVLKTTKFRDAKHNATLNILYTAYWLKSHVSVVLKKNDLTLEQYHVLRILKGKYPERMCVKDIGSRMIEKSSNVPRIIERLVKKNIVERTVSTQDKRETLIHITEKGIELLEKTNAIILEIESGLIGVNEEEATELNNILEKLRKTNQ